MNDATACNNNRCNPPKPLSKRTHACTKTQSQVDTCGQPSTRPTTGKISNIVVIFDGQCSLCRKQADYIRCNDSDGAFELIPSQRPNLIDRFPQLVDCDLDSQLHAIGHRGELYAGADAVHKIASHLPLLKQFAWFYKLPGIPRIAQIGYNWIAARRHRFF